MKLHYDKRGDVFSIRFLSEQTDVRDQKLAPNVYASFNKAGQLVEIQILDYSETRESDGFSLAVAAAILGVSERTLQRRIEELPENKRPKKVGREYQIKPDELKRIGG